MSKECTAEAFLKDVADHVMTVKRDDGIYRHLHFRNAPPHSWNMWFEIVTWPGVLTIHGDMGTWTFARVEEMFKFFRDDKLEINPYYWSEKLQHGVHGGRDGSKVWNEDLFRQQLLERLEGYDGEDREAVVQALKDDVFCHDNKYELMLAARDFKCGDFQFDPCELPDGKEYAYSFIWCCFALVWAIQQYDAMVSAKQEPAAV
jgi:hypothetical protein